MKYGINCGHCLLRFDTGASGVRGLREQDLTRLVGNLVMAKLKSKGHTVINCTMDSAASTDAALGGICTKANAQKLDQFISIHLNASPAHDGHGTELYTMGAKSNDQELSILKNLSALGLTNRGVKDGSHLWVVKNTHAPAMLIEVCFIDNIGDMKIFNAEQAATAIINGLLGASAASKVISQAPAATVAAAAPKVAPVTAATTAMIKKFQIFYNTATQTAAPLSTDGISGPKTAAAYTTLGNLIGGKY